MKLAPGVVRLPAVRIAADMGKNLLRIMAAGEPLYLRDDLLAAAAGDTAIHRRERSRPLTKLTEISELLLHGRIFHQGPGRSDNPDRDLVRTYGDSVIEYDPQFGPKDRSGIRKHDCDAAVSFYVLNVLPPQARWEALLDLSQSLKPEGVAYIAVRGKSGFKDPKKYPRWTEFDDGCAVYAYGRHHFQRHYNLSQLHTELEPYFSTVDFILQTSACTFVAAKGARLWQK